MDALEKIQQWKIQGHTQREIAQKLGTTESQISRWLRGITKIGYAWRKILAGIENW